MAFNKLRAIHKEELKLRRMAMEHTQVVRTAKDPIQIRDPPPKIVFDLEKLEKSAEKFRLTTESLKKKPIVVLDKLPVPVVRVTATTPVAICQARNINGTPCKCKATKLGKFCAKHVP